MKKSRRIDIQQRNANLLNINQAVDALRQNQSTLKNLEIQPFTAVAVRNHYISYSVACENSEELKQLTDALKVNTSLEQIQFNFAVAEAPDLIDTASITAMGKAIKDHPALTQIIIMAPHAAIKLEVVLGLLDCFKGSAKIGLLSLIIPSDTPSFLNELGNLLLLKTSLETLLIRNMCTYISQCAAEEKTSLRPFADGLAAQTGLKQLTLIALTLGDDGISDIAAALTKAYSIARRKENSSLQLFELRSCKIEDQMQHVCSIVRQNPFLDKLNLSGNPLTENSMQALCKALPEFKKLVSLNLSDTNMSKKMLSTFATTCTQHALNIKKLDLSHHHFALIDPSLASITTLIRGNIRLKKLYINHISQTQFKKIAPLLQNPAECQLEKLHFLDPSQILSAETEKYLLRILYNNEYLYDIGNIRKSREVLVACNVNERKKMLREWNLFMDACFWLFSASNSKLSGKIKDYSFYFHIILTFIVPKKPELIKNQYSCYLKLIQENIKKRNEMKESGIYKPETDLIKDSFDRNKKTVRLFWWSQSLDGKNLFASQITLEPGLMTLPRIIQTISPYLYARSTEQKPSSQNNDSQILVDISHLSLGKQRYIRDTFLLFVEYFYFNPKVSIEKESKKLIITQLSLEQMKKDIAEFSLSSPAVTAANQCCNMM